MLCVVRHGKKCRWRSTWEMSEWRRDIAMLMRQECNKARKIGMASQPISDPNCALWISRLAIRNSFSTPSIFLTPSFLIVTTAFPRLPSQRGHSTKAGNSKATFHPPIIVHNGCKCSEHDGASARFVRLEWIADHRFCLLVLLNRYNASLRQHC